MTHAQPKYETRLVKWVLARVILSCFDRFSLKIPPIELVCYSSAYVGPCTKHDAEMRHHPGPIVKQHSECGANPVSEGVTKRQTKFPYVATRHHHHPSRIVFFANGPTVPNNCSTERAQIPNERLTDQRID
mmetsp:Transcript_2245/g.4941  ORF Transcript_2245/g.4941 Transcript_2245/m.4941 type:complete len:131 (+) Transcript_2245:442-834(+)